MREVEIFLNGIFYYYDTHVFMIKEEFINNMMSLDKFDLQPVPRKLLVMSVSEWTG